MSVEGLPKAQPWAEEELFGFDDFDDVNGESEALEATQAPSLTVAGEHVEEGTEVTSNEIISAKDEKKDEDKESLFRAFLGSIALLIVGASYIM